MDPVAHTLAPGRLGERRDMIATTAAEHAVKVQMALTIRAGPVGCGIGTLVAVGAIKGLKTTARAHEHLLVRCRTGETGTHSLVEALSSHVQVVPENQWVSPSCVAAFVVSSATVSTPLRIQTDECPVCGRRARRPHGQRLTSDRSETPYCPRSAGHSMSQSTMLGRTRGAR